MGTLRNIQGARGGQGMPRHFSGTSVLEKWEQSEIFSLRGLKNSKNKIFQDLLSLVHVLKLIGPSVFGAIDIHN